MNYIFYNYTYIYISFSLMDIECIMQETINNASES